MSIAEQRLTDLGIILPKIDLRGRGLISVREHHDMLFISGQGPLDEHRNPVWTGKLGKDLTIEEGYQAAQLCGINLLAKLKNHLGDLDRIDKIIKIFGLIASSPDFYEQPAVLHGCSDLMVDVFGERGQHTRSAMGTNVLPMNIPVEVEMIVTIRK